MESDDRDDISVRDAMVVYAGSLARCRDDAEDLVQDAWIRMLGSAVPVKNKRRFLSVTIRRLWIDGCRQRARRPSCSLDDMVEQPQAGDMQADAQHAHMVQRFREVLATLPEPHARAVWLVMAEQQTSGDAAAATGLTPDNVRQIIRRFRERLRRTLAPGE